MEPIPLFNFPLRLDMTLRYINVDGHGVHGPLSTVF